jgi:hypothetical protein
MYSEFRGTISGDDSSLVTLHGFRVQSYGEPITPGFKKGLRRLAERGFDDPTCVVVKTPSGNQSGITHAGGRYVHPDGAYSAEVMREMRAQGMEPPPPPFLVAPGEFTLYHEWGHHVDRTWSGESQDIGFSFRWFSRFYQVEARTSRIIATGHEPDAADAVVLWWHASSELFANLFEDWMRADKKTAWDECEPDSLNRSASHGNHSVRIALRPQISVEAIRADTYRLFKSGLRTPAELPPVRQGLFGENTDELVDRLREVMAIVKATQR